MVKNKREGQVAKKLEDYTASLPSDVYLWIAVGFMCVSITFKILRKDDIALFIGQWAAPALLAGVYNKIVKTQGSD